MIEPTKEIGIRNLASTSESQGRTSQNLESKAYLRMAVFNYMVGNTDWNVKLAHNVKFLKGPIDSLYTPIPYDEAWLPIYHNQIEGWNMTALFSNTARAHELEKTDDWVIIFFDKEKISDQVTVVTEIGGPLKGKRVIRGLEAECSVYYNSQKEAKTPIRMPYINPLT